MAKPWTSEEVDFLRDNIEKISRVAIAEALQRSEKSIQVKSSKLGLIKKEIASHCKTCGVPLSPDSGRTLFCSDQCHDKDVLKRKVQKRADAAAKKRAHAWEINSAEQPEVFAKFAQLPKSQKEAQTVGSSQYFTGLKCPNGNVAPRYTPSGNCVTCRQEENQVRYAELKRSGEYAAVVQRTSELRRQRLQDPAYRQERNAWFTEWRKRNPEKVRRYEQKHRTNNPNRVIRERLQARLKFVLKNAGTKKSATLESYVGCTSKELVEHISSFFTDTINWETRDQWDIDHIRPCASFDLTDDEQAKVCFNWRNLAPLDSFENYSKGDNYEPHDEAAWSYLMRELGYEGELFLVFEEGRGGLYGQEAAGEVDT